MFDKTNVPKHSGRYPFNFFTEDNTSGAFESVKRELQDYVNVVIDVTQAITILSDFDNYIPWDECFTKKAIEKIANELHSSSKFPVKSWPVRVIDAIEDNVNRYIIKLDRGAPHFLQAIQRSIDWVPSLRSANEFVCTYEVLMDANHEDQEKVAEALGIDSVNEMRSMHVKAKQYIRNSRARRAKYLKYKGYNYGMISEELGVSFSIVANLLKNKE